MFLSKPGDLSIMSGLSLSWNFWSPKIAACSFLMGRCQSSGVSRDVPLLSGFRVGSFSAECMFCSFFHSRSVDNIVSRESKRTANLLALNSPGGIMYLYVLDVSLYCDLLSLSCLLAPARNVPSLRSDCALGGQGSAPERTFQSSTDAVRPTV